MEGVSKPDLLHANKRLFPSHLRPQRLRFPLLVENGNIRHNLLLFKCVVSGAGFKDILGTGNSNSGVNNINNNRNNNNDNNNNNNNNNNSIITSNTDKKRNNNNNRNKYFTW